MDTKIDAVINLVAGTARGWRGAAVKGRARKQPEQLLKLYDIEISPYCRMVREVLTELDLDVMILPCPAGGDRFRPQAQALGGKQQFPLLVDDNTNTVMYESADIIEYLGSTYQGKVSSPTGLMRKLAVGSGMLASALQYRPGGLRGMKVRPSKAPDQPLELYSFEASPFSKPVRNVLCELQLPYVLHNTGKGALTDLGPPMFRDKLFKGPMGTTRNRQWLADRTGQVQVPYLIDPNTGVEMYESQAIVDYLESTYAG